MSAFDPSITSPFDEPTITSDLGTPGGASLSGTRESAASGRDLVGRVARGAHDTIDRLSETAAPRVQRLQDGVSAASAAVQARAGQLRQTGEEWTDSLRSTVRANPLTAVGVALAVGMVVSRLTRR